MEDRRRNKRMDLEAKLMVKRLDSDEKHAVVIDISDVSKTGVGFSSLEKLDIGAVYETYLTIWTKEVIHAFLQIVRIEMKDTQSFHYGATFVGMSELDASRISVYETVTESEQK